MSLSSNSYLNSTEDLRNLTEKYRNTLRQVKRPPEFKFDINKAMENSGLNKTLDEINKVMEDNRAAQKKIARLRMIAFGLTVVGVVATIAAGVTSK